MLNRERDDLMDTLTEQKAVLGEVRQREFEAYNQVKKSCHMVEQAQLEKAEVNEEMNGWNQNAVLFVGFIASFL